MIALAIFPSDVSGTGRWRITLDGLMITCAVGLVSWATALGAVVRAGGDSPLALAVSVAYPASDIALLVVCVLVMSRSRAHRLPLAIIAAGLALMAVADSGFAYLTATNSYVTDSPIDLGWFLAFGALAFASLTPSATEAGPRHELPLVAGAAMPYVVLGGSLALMTWQMAATNAVSVVEMVLFVVLVLLVFFRQFLTVRDNQRLARALTLREAQLRYQAFHDPLTGLANRALFIDRATHALELHRRDQRPLAICFLDLDGFKAVNDRLGHSAGDDLLGPGRRALPAAPVRGRDAGALRRRRVRRAAGGPARAHRDRPGAARQPAGTVHRGGPRGRRCRPASAWRGSGCSTPPRPSTSC